MYINGISFSFKVISHSTSNVYYNYLIEINNFFFLHSHAINKAFKILRIKNESPDIASQRLLLFHVARNILAQGMKLLGLMPLEEM